MGTTLDERANVVFVQSRTLNSAEQMGGLLMESDVFEGRRSYNIVHLKGAEKTIYFLFLG